MLEAITTYLAPAFAILLLGASAPALKERKVEMKVETREEEAQAEPPSSIEELIADAFGDEAPLALAIAKAESSLDPNAINKANRNGSIDRGIFQINSIHCGKVDCDRLFEVAYNIEVAKQIRDGSGWRAWSVYNNGRYKRFLE